MRVKDVWNYVPLPSKLKLVWMRLTFSKVTTAYILFSIIHCFIQLGLQVRAFTINANAASFLFSLSVKAGAINNSVPCLMDPDHLVLCPDVPTAYHGNLSACQVVWNGTAVQNTFNASLQEQAWAGLSSSSSADITSSIPSSSSSLSTSTSSSSVSASKSAISSSKVASDSTTRSVSPTAAVTTTVVKVVVSSAAAPSSTPKPSGGSADDHHDADDDDDDDDDDNDSPGVGLNALAIHQHEKRQNADLKILTFSEDGHTKVNISLGNQLDSAATLSSSCVWSLNWPVSILDDTKREDIVFISFQIWVLGMSFVALLNESIPHVIASLLTHVGATAWAGFQVASTANFHTDFNRVITNGACHGVPSLLGGYWTTRQKVEYASLALNVVALFVSGFLSWKLFKQFGWQTFKRVGASLTINRIYKLVLVLSIALQLSLFFMGATVSLWIDSLFNGVGAQHGDFIALYRGTSFATIILLLPWFTTGYLGVRKELRLPMFVFLFLSLLYLAAWSTMFLSNTFRWNFISWRFFSVMASVSVFLTTITFVLGVICRYNFGKGLPRYLNAHEPLPGDDFAPVYSSDLEKVEFPSKREPIPTFSAAFGKGSEVPVPSQMFPARMGPRFFRSAEPFESRSVSPVTQPSAAMTRSSVMSDDSYKEDGPMVMRSNSRSSERSYGSVGSYYTYPNEAGQHTRSGSSASHETMGGKRWVIE